jgi:acetyl-CoA carboxylase alpha subunit
MLENATYSVITPEGCAAILWRDADFAPQAAESLRPTASQLLELLAVEKVVEEPRGGAHHNPELAALRLGEAIAEALAELDEIPPLERRRQRRERFRRLGRWSDPEQPPGSLSLFGGYSAPVE